MPDADSKRRKSNGRRRGQQMEDLKPCLQAEIDAYFEFASLPLQERRRRVFERMIETMPDSPFVFDLLTGRIEMPKKRGRKRIARAASKPKTAKPKTLKVKAAAKA